MKESERLAAGVFDSGVGGLTVLYECMRQNPQATFYYLGDNLRAPYGSRPKEEIVSFVREALSAFEKIGVSAAVLACNTATAVAAEEMRKEFPFSVIGMEPAVKPAAEVAKNVLVLATPRTAESDRLHALIARFPACRFTVFPAAGLAAAVEDHIVRRAPLTLSAHLPRGSYDGVVLGCTHYVYLREEIAKFYNAPVFDGNKGAARRLSALLYGQKTGTDDHLLTTRKTNDCLTKKDINRVIFLGNCQKINQNVFLRTFVLEKNKK